jgi:hypothetical protein
MEEPGDHEIVGNPTQPLALRNEDLHDYLTRFALHGLLLELNVPRHGLMLAEVFTGQVIAALALKNLILPSSPHLLAPADASQLHKQPYCLLSPIRRHAVFKFSTHPSINANNLGIEEFRRLNRKLPNPLPAEGNVKPLIFICALVQFIFILCYSETLRSALR